MSTLNPLKINWFTIVCVFVIALLILFVPDFRAGVSNFSFKTFLLPVKTISLFTSGIKSGSEIYQENSELKLKYGELSLKLAQMKGLSDENERLRALLDFKKTIVFETIVADVISRNPNDWLESFMIDKGTEDGIKKNSAVCSPYGLVGKVVDAGINNSNVALLTNSGFKVGGILEIQRINGVVVGTGDGFVSMLYLPVDIEINVGETVVTSEFSTIFPKGIPIGNIISVHMSKTGLYKYAIVKPIVNSFDQEEVLCLK